jgi:hypothetical protein
MEMHRGSSKDSALDSAYLGNIIVICIVIYRQQFITLNEWFQLKMEIHRRSSKYSALKFAYLGNIIVAIAQKIISILLLNMEMFGNSAIEFTYELIKIIYDSTLVFLTIWLDF